jgi:lon-related putative ATP-dependent protease
LNLLVDHRDSKRAPVLFEDHPTFENLIGRIEHQAQMGTLVTDFNLIRPGALHRANGGFLMLDVRKVLQQPYAWEGLKRALKARCIRTESLGQALSLVSTASLEPDPVPLDIKVVLLGDRSLYYLLHAFDPEFRELFKVAADFEDSFDRTPEQQQGYAGLIAMLTRSNQLRPLDPPAVARVIEHSTRLSGDAQKLSSQIDALVDLLREADHWAGQLEREVIARADVQRALDERRYRNDRLRERTLEATLRGTHLVATEGAVVGQINGLSVVQLGDAPFGHPSRITARVRLGKGEVVDIEREVELGGPIHSKGVLILSNYLGAHYADDQPLSLHASLVFEQSYGGVEGDSASCAELYALLSAIAELPIRQGLAVTGSVNQHGEVQPIGGVNEKIEGFFDLCNARGLSGDQGVLIPAANTQHLMLRDDVIEAVRQGRFHIYPLTTIDQGVALLMGVPAGRRDEDGHYPEGCLDARVTSRLAELTDAGRAAEARIES